MVTRTGINVTLIRTWLVLQVNTGSYFYQIKPLTYSSVNAKC